MNEPHSTSSFASPSDALFATLVNKYKDVVAKELFDDVLALFRHPEFRSERVTLRETDDIFVTVHIADQEQVTARSRLRAVERIGAQSRTGHQFSHHPQIPNLVMELLAEYLDANRVPFRYTLWATKYEDTRRPVVCDVNRMLANMSLVHRSWTVVAQQLLRRRIYLDQNTLHSKLLGSQFGPWVRQLSFRSDCTDHKVLRSLCIALERCPNITHLHVDNVDFDPADNYVELEPEGTYPDVLSKITNLKRLEYLWLYRSDMLFARPRTLRKLCAVLRVLRSLKSLGLRNWGDEDELKELRTAGTELDFTDATNLSPTLESLSLVNICTPGLITWLFSPRNGDHISRLELSCGDLDGEFHRGFHTVSLLRNAMPTQTTKLQLVDYYSDFDLGFVEEIFHSLRSLSLCTSSARDGMPPGPVRLPDSVQEFYFYFHDHKPVSSNPDRSVLETLRASPNVRRVAVTYAPIDIEFGDYFQSSFKDTIEYTAMNNVEFTVTEVEGPPHFLDL